MSVESVINVMETPRKMGMYDSDFFRVIRGCYDLPFMTVVSVLYLMRHASCEISEY